MNASFTGRFTIFCESVSEHIEWFFNYVYQNYFDVYYVEWLIYVLYPIIITLILPALIFLLLYASQLFLQLYRLRQHFGSVLHMDCWDGARQIIAAVWAAHGKIWHGYEISGFEKIPDEGPALLVYYHGALPVDLYYLIANVILHKQRCLRAVGDRFLFIIPGLRLLWEVSGVSPGSVSSCVELLRQGHILAIAPGGVREAFFSNEYYELVWGKRIGFAKVATEARVPVIPVFTQNCREAFRALSFARSWLRWLYEKTRLPLIPIYGGFPVKMITHIGDPIPFDPSISSEQLALQVYEAVDSLIQQHQKPLPGNILRALLQRICSRDQT